MEDRESFRDHHRYRVRAKRVIGVGAMKRWIMYGLVGMTMVLSSISLPAKAEDDPAQCQVTATWGDIEGRSSTIMIMRQNQEQFDDEDSVLIAFFNDDWSITKDETLGRIRVANEDGDWLDNEAIAMDHGFMIWSNFEHVDNVFGGVPQAMFVSRAGKTIDNLKLTDLFRDWMDFRACRSKKVATKAERDRKAKLGRGIPQDPFAK